VEVEGERMAMLLFVFVAGERTETAARGLDARPLVAFDVAEIMMILLLREQQRRWSAPGEGVEESIGEKEL